MMRRILLAAGVAAALSIQSAAFAQNGPPPDDQGPPGEQGAPPAKPPHSGHHGDKMEEKFQQANTTHDGRLTLNQASAAGMRHVIKHFNEIDLNHKGYVTLADMKAFRHREKAEKGGGHGHSDGAPPPDQSGPPPQ